MRIWRWISCRMSTIMAVAAALGLGMVIGNTVMPKEGDVPVPTPTGEENPSQEAGNIGVVSILPTTTVEWRYRFTECGHEFVDSGGDDVLGYTLSDIAAAYPDSRVTEMSTEYTAIERILAEYCPQHYVLVWTEEETLCVFHTEESTFETVELMQLKLEPQNLDETLLEPLRDGLAFDSLQAINEYLEDAES